MKYGCVETDVASRFYNALAFNWKNEHRKCIRMGWFNNARSLYHGRLLAKGLMARGSLAWYHYFMFKSNRIGFIKWVVE